MSERSGEGPPRPPSVFDNVAWLIPEWIRSRSSRERDLEAELRTHMEMAVEDRVARGESRDEAERAVRREFGNEVRVKEVTRSQWGGIWLDRLLQPTLFMTRPAGI